MRAIGFGVMALAACGGNGPGTQPASPAETASATSPGELAAAPPEPAAAPDAPAAESEAEYATLLIAALTRHHPGTTFTFDAARSLVSGGTMSISTGNLYVEYTRLPASERATALERVATAMNTRGAGDPALAEVVADLRPVIRAGTYFEYVQLMARAPGGPEVPAPAFAPFGELAAAGVVIDEPTSMTVVNQSHLARWGLTLAQAMELATSNYAAGGVQLRQLQPGLWTSDAHDNYDASVLLLPAELAKLGLRGTPVAMIPNRDTVYLASADDEGALVAMADLVDAIRDEPRPIHTVPLCLERGTWRECEPGPTPAVRQRMHTLATLGRLSLYEEQRPPLQEHVGDDQFVATYKVVQDEKSGALTSVAVWTHTVTTLLPRADFVALVEVVGDGPDPESRMLGFVPWADLERVMGSQLAPDGRSPPRWSTGTAWPSKRELAKLAPRPHLSR